MADLTLSNMSSDEDESFDCMNCLENAFGPNMTASKWFQCTEGHILCQGCHALLGEGALCPTCGVLLGSSRNRSLEKMVQRYLKLTSAPKAVQATSPPAQTSISGSVLDVLSVESGYLPLADCAMSKELSQLQLNDDEASPETHSSKFSMTDETGGVSGSSLVPGPLESSPKALALPATQPPSSRSLECSRSCLRQDANEHQTPAESNATWRR